MTNNERRNWIINIERRAAVVESQLGWEVVKSVFERYGAKNICDLNPKDLPEVLTELYANEDDQRYSNCSPPDTASPDH